MLDQSACNLSRKVIRDNVVGTDSKNRDQNLSQQTKQRIEELHYEHQYVGNRLQSYLSMTFEIRRNLRKNCCNVMDDQYDKDLQRRPNDLYQTATRRPTANIVHLAQHSWLRYMQNRQDQDDSMCVKRAYQRQESYYQWTLEALKSQKNFNRLFNKYISGVNEWQSQDLPITFRILLSQYQRFEEVPQFILKRITWLLGKKVPKRTINLWISQAKDRMYFDRSKMHIVHSKRLAQSEQV